MLPVLHTVRALPLAVVVTTVTIGAPMALTACPGTSAQTVIHDVVDIEKALCTVVEDFVDSEWVKLACEIPSIITGGDGGTVSGKPQIVYIKVRKSLLPGFITPTAASSGKPSPLSPAPTSSATLAPKALPSAAASPASSARK